MNELEPLLPKHGGYRKLKTFQIARLIYDLTVVFCERYIDRFSRTQDQMVQAARAGVQNIAEGSQASGTSKKTEIKLTNAARASHEELKLDYEDFLRHRNLPLLSPDDPILKRFKDLRCSKMAEVEQWIDQEIATLHFVSVRESSCESVSLAGLMANAVLSLLNLECHLLKRQIASQGNTFEKEGGFTERLYRVRKNKRQRSVPNQNPNGTPARE